MEDIRADMHTYEEKFQVSIIPHINDNNQIVDNIHNYMPKGKQERADASKNEDTFED